MALSPLMFPGHNLAHANLIAFPAASCYNFSTHCPLLFRYTRVSLPWSLVRSLLTS